MRSIVPPPTPPIPHGSVPSILRHPKPPISRAPAALFYAVCLLTLLLNACGDLLGTGAGRTSALEFVDPARSEGGVSVLTSLILRFAEPVDPASVGRGVTLLDGVRHTWLDVSSLDDRTFVLTTSDPLDFGTRYTVRVSRSVTYADGRPLAREESWGFITEGRKLPRPSSDRMRANLRALAHDSMRGRGSGTPGERKAAQYLAALLAEYGLTAPPGGAIQEFTARSARTGDLIASQNVLGMVRGEGQLGGDWIVVGAHYDHIGFRNLPDESQGPNNGADDNASGTALLLEIARQYQAWTASDGGADRDRRSVLFVAFGAEEEGLLGSCFYTDEAPTVPLGRTRVMMNFDMVGRLREGQLELRLREDSDEWRRLLTDANEPALHLNLKAMGGTGGTDYVCFGHHDIPFVGFFTGLHPEYHTPSDDVSLINFPGMKKVAELGLRVLGRLVVTPTPPTYP